jgi:hypothetical protein
MCCASGTGGVLVPTPSSDMRGDQTIRFRDPGHAELAPVPIGRYYRMTGFVPHSPPNSGLPRGIFDRSSSMNRDNDFLQSLAVADWTVC